MRVVSCLVSEHDLTLVLLAASVCICGTWVTFDLIQRARDRSGAQKLGWVFLTAVAAGCSIWCTHFIAMLAYEVQAPVTFDPIMTLNSLFIAIAGCGAGILVALHDNSRWAPLAGGAIIGVAISAMHYTGMNAYHVDGWVAWDAGHIVMSIALAVGLGGASLYTYLRRPWPYSHHTSLALFVLAIVSLHFTGMAAITVTPSATGAAIADTAIMHAMAVAVAGVGFIVVATGVASHLIDSQASFETIKRLQELALNDSLTAMPNRINFHNQLSEKLTRGEATGRKVAVLGIDLDRFKEINDLRGHEAGDKTLQIIAARLKNLLIDGEFAARIGGDEFACTKIYREHAELVDFVGRVEKALHTPFRLDDMETVPGASIGVAIYPQDGDTQERLISNADLAMYRAKADPSRTVCYYEAQMDEASRDRLGLALDLRLAIEHNELALHYQVQKDIVTGTVSGYEVLLRWTHPGRGNISPSDFIPLAEETGSILAIGDWVLRTACSAAASWSEPHKIAVNISPAQLSHVDLAERVHDILLETGLAADRLELEITETTIIHDKQRVLEQLRRLQSFGVTIAIDDFGTGYSSLDTLRSFPFNKIKLDRSFMNDIGENPQATAIVRAVLALGKSLDIPILAEGVETKEQLEMLRLEGCDEAQGYLLGRPAPMSAEAIAKSKAA